LDLRLRGHKLRKQILTCAKIKTHVKEGKLFPRSALTEGGGVAEVGGKSLPCALKATDHKLKVSPCVPKKCMANYFLL
jgi:hypothetical protein